MRDRAFSAFTLGGYNGGKAAECVHVLIDLSHLIAVIVQMQSARKRERESV